MSLDFISDSVSSYSCVVLNDKIITNGEWEEVERNSS
jgi:hypothetical protein